MALSDAKKAADKRHTAKLDNIMVRPYREEGAAIRAAAAAAGKSVQGYVLGAVREKMERERTGAVHANSPAVEDRPGGGFGFSAGSPGENSSSRFISQWGPDFQTVLADSGQSLEEFVSQAVAERIERERKPLIPQWIAEKYPGERWPVLKAVRAVQGNMNAQRLLRASMTQEQRVEWDKEFRRELDEERRQGARQDPPAKTCNLPLDDF